MAEPAEWAPEGQEVFYRKMTVYAPNTTERAAPQTLWRKDDGEPDDRASLGDMLIAAAPYGGPVAMAKDPKKAEEGVPTVMRVFSSSGTFISKWRWPRRKSEEASEGGGADTKLLAMAWMLDESLCTIATNGKVFIYHMHGDIKSAFSITEKCDAPGTEVRMASFFLSGFVCIVSGACDQDGDDEQPKVDSAKLLSYLNDNGDEKMEMVCELDDLTVEPTAIECVPPEMASQDELEIFITPHETDNDGGTIWECGPLQDGVKDLETSGLGPVAKLALSPNARYIATFNTTGKVNVCKIDLGEDGNLTEFNTKSEVPPHQMVWGGNNCVVCSWLPDQLNAQGGENTKSLVLIIGPKDDHEKFTYVGPVHLVPECDSVRVVSNEMCDIIQKVPDSTRDIFEKSSQHPAVILWDAFVDYEDERAGSVKAIRKLRASQLEEAIEHCIDAAGHEFDKDLQARLLKAASYGKCFCKGATAATQADKYVEQCKTLRVLNAVRDAKVGIPLTWEQSVNLSMETLIDRLVARRLYLLAYRVSNYLGGHKTEKVLVAWACAKVKTEAPDARIAADVEARFRECPGISYAEVAQQAFMQKKQELAILLLEREPKASDQVPLLLNFDEDDKALGKAIESGDTDLIYLVVLNMRHKHPDEKFMQTLAQPAYATARDLYTNYCGSKDRNFLHNFYTKTNNHVGIGFLALRSFLDAGDDLKQKKKCLEAAEKRFKEMKERSVECKAMSDQVKLVEKQEKLAKEKKQPDFIGASLMKTLTLLFQCKAGSEADKIKKDFGVSDRMYQWTKLRALTKYGLWDDLADWAKKLKPVIGFKPFVDECMKNKKDGDRGRQEAGKYVARIADYGERCQMYCALGMYKDAIDVAEKERDPGLLAAVRERTTNPTERARIDKLRAQLS